MAEGATTEGDYLDLEIIEQELERWLAMHAAARSIFEGLPPEQQDAIRRDGQASIVPLASLVSCRPDLRELGATILQRILDDTRTIRTSATPWVVEPGQIGLSHPLATVGGVGEDDDTITRLEDRMTALEAVAEEILSLLRARHGTGGTSAQPDRDAPLSG